MFPGKENPFISPLHPKKPCLPDVSKYDNQMSTQKNTCHCGHEMKLKLLKTDMPIFNKCSCGEIYDAYIYPSWIQLMICDSCGCTH